MYILWTSISSFRWAQLNDWHVLLYQSIKMVLNMVKKLLFFFLSKPYVSCLFILCVWLCACVLKTIVNHAIVIISWKQLCKEYRLIIKTQKKKNRRITIFDSLQKTNRKGRFWLQMIITLFGTKAMSNKRWAISDARAACGNKMSVAQLP